MIRGVLGHGLRKVTCLGRCSHNNKCVLSGGCLFNTAFNGKGEFKHSKVMPFTLEFERDERTHLEAGERVSFYLTLFGDIQKNIPYFIYAFKEGGKYGIGKKIDGCRACFDVEAVLSEDEAIYSESNHIVLLNHAVELLELGGKNRDSNIDSYGGVKVEFFAPFRVKYKNSLATAAPFEIFIRAILRRVTSVFEAYGRGRPDIDYTTLISLAKKIKTVHDNLRWLDIARYSNRQKSAMKFGGLVGSVTYNGDISPFTELIRIGSILHIGKQATFGYGSYTFEFTEKIK